MNIKNSLSEKIAGEITLSPKPGKTIRKWRNIFNISQTELANSLGFSPSVISDYESGRRKSPGIKTIKKIIVGLIEIDEKHGGKTLLRYDTMFDPREGILEIMEYPYAIPVEQLVDEISGNVLTSEKIVLNKNVKGFTIVDSVKTIESISSIEYAHLYGWSADRALVFTGIRYGRSPMIAVRVHPVKPNAVIYHKPGSVDPLAIKLAEFEKIPLIVTNLSFDDLKTKLIKLGDR